jgi:glycosyltransferase involved in cell wall biosynthesis
MMSAPRVSVILPTRNRATTLPQAVGSVLSQTFQDLELIVVDDASSDATESAIKAIADPRIAYVRLPEHRGAAVARNTGIRQARGELIAFQDSDDEWSPTKLEHQIDLLTREGSTLGAVGGRYAIDGDSTMDQISAPRLETADEYESELLEGSCLITPLWLIRRSLLIELGLFDERMPCLEDWDLMLRLSTHARMRALDETVLIKGGAPDSLGADFSRRAPAMEEILRRHGRRFLAHPRRHAAFCLELSYLCFANGHPLKAVRYTLRAFRRRGVSRQLVVAFAWACARRVRWGHATWPIPGLAEAENQTRRA